MLENIISENLDDVLNEFSDKLGNREDYVGASDIGKCERNIVLSKIYGVDYPTKQKMIMLRGHLAESIVRMLLKKAGLFFKEQYEIIHPEYKFIKAHIDFLFQDKNAKGVLEVKTTTGIPDEPYPSWVEQLQLQMGLVKLRFSDEVRGAILVIDLSNGEIKEFNGYKPSAEIFDALVEKAKAIYEKVQAKETEDLPCEINGLCAFCPFKKDCPAFTGDEPMISEELNKAVENYIAVSQEEKEIKEKKDRLKQEILGYTGNNFQAKFNGHKLSIKETVSVRVDTNLLKSEYPDVYQSVIKEIPFLSFRIT